jgi:hypothetical protein
MKKNLVPHITVNSQWKNNESLGRASRVSHCMASICAARRQVQRKARNKATHNIRHSRLLAGVVGVVSQHHDILLLVSEMS